MASKSVSGTPLRRSMVKTRLAEASGKGFGATLVDDIPDLCASDF